MNFELQKKYI